MKKSFDLTWEQIHRARSWGKYPSEFLIRTVIGHVKPRLSSLFPHALDLGSGQGANTWLLIREGFSVTAVDASATAIKKLRVRLRLEGISHGFTARVFDFTAPLPWKDNSFDLVVDHCSLYSNPRSVIRNAANEIYRILKPGGWLISCGFTNKTTTSENGIVMSSTRLHKKIPYGPLAGTGRVQFLDKKAVLSTFSQYQNCLYDEARETRLGGEINIEWWRFVGMK